MDKEFVFLAPLSALIGIIFDPILACAGIMMVLTLSALLYCSQAKEEKKALEDKIEELKASQARALEDKVEELKASQAREERKALEDKVEELKAKLERMALAKIQSETERVLLQYYAMERGGFLRRRIKSSSDIGGLAG